MLGVSEGSVCSCRRLMDGRTAHAAVPIGPQSAAVQLLPLRCRLSATGVGQVIKQEI